MDSDGIIDIGTYSAFMAGLSLVVAVVSMLGVFQTCSQSKSYWDARKLPSSAISRIARTGPEDGLPATASEVLDGISEKLASKSSVVEGEHVYVDRSHGIHVRGEIRHVDGSGSATACRISVYDSKMRPIAASITVDAGESSYDLNLDDLFDLDDPDIVASYRVVPLGPAREDASSELDKNGDKLSAARSERLRKEKEERRKAEEEQKARKLEEERKSEQRRKAEESRRQAEAAQADFARQKAEELSSADEDGDSEPYVGGDMRLPDERRRNIVAPATSERQPEETGKAEEDGPTEAPRPNEPDDDGEQFVPTTPRVKYSWTSVRTYNNAMANYDGTLSHWTPGDGNDGGKFYIAHDYSSYGPAIKGLAAGDVVIVDGVAYTIAGSFDVPRNGTAEGVRAEVGQSATVFQTCNGTTSFHIVYTL